MGKSVVGGVTFGELTKSMFNFFQEMRTEYNDDDKLTPAEVLGCLADLFADLEEKADDLIYQRCFGAVSGICDMVASLLDPGP